MTDPLLMKAVLSDLEAGASDGALIYVHGRADLLAAAHVAGCFLLDDGAPIEFAHSRLVELLEMNGMYWDGVPADVVTGLYNQLQSWRRPQEAVPWGSGIVEIPNRNFTTLHLPAPRWLVDYASQPPYDDFGRPIDAWERFTRFALTFNGYIAYGDLPTCAGIRDTLFRSFERAEAIPEEFSLADLRAAVFSLQRAWKHSGHFELGGHDVAFIDYLTDGMRSRVI